MILQVVFSILKVVTATPKVKTAMLQLDNGYNLTGMKIIYEDISLFTSVSTFRFPTNSTLQAVKRKELPLFAIPRLVETLLQFDKV